MGDIAPCAQLLRRFSVEFLTGHREDAARAIMAADYSLSISGHRLAGREESYLPATLDQLAQFPGLCVTTHDVVIGHDMAAMRFTEHGAQRRDGIVSTWGGITLFRIASNRLVEGWAEEDYFARKRQLKSKQVDAILAPHPCPWDQPALGADADTEAKVRAWLSDVPRLLRGVEEISAEGPKLVDLIEPETIALSALFTAGPRAALHGVLSGRYSGGFVEIEQSTLGRRISLPIAALVDTDAKGVVRAQICGDRLGLHRSLLPPR